jgi:hypothetical protein
VGDISDGHRTIITNILHLAIYNQADDCVLNCPQHNCTSHSATLTVPLIAVVVRTPTYSLSAIHDISNLPYSEIPNQLSIMVSCTGHHTNDFSVVLQVQHLGISLSRNFHTTIDYSLLYNPPPTLSALYDMPGTPKLSNPAVSSLLSQSFDHLNTYMLDNSTANSLLDYY